MGLLFTEEGAQVQRKEPPMADTLQALHSDTDVIGLTSTVRGQHPHHLHVNLIETTVYASSLLMVTSLSTRPGLSR